MNLVLSILKNQLTRYGVAGGAIAITSQYFDVLMSIGEFRGALLVVIIGGYLVWRVHYKQASAIRHEQAATSANLYQVETWLLYYLHMSKSLIDADKRLQSAKHGTQAYNKALASYNTVSLNVDYALVKMYGLLEPLTIAKMNKSDFGQLAKEYRQFMGDTGKDTQQENED